MWRIHSKNNLFIPLTKYMKPCSSARYHVGPAKKYMVKASLSIIHRKL